MTHHNREEWSFPTTQLTLATPVSNQSAVHALVVLAVHAPVVPVVLVVHAPVFPVVLAVHAPVVLAALLNQQTPSRYDRYYLSQISSLFFVDVDISEN